MQPHSARDLLDQCVRSPEPRAWERFVERYGPAIEAGVRRALRRVRALRPAAEAGRCDGAADPGQVQDMVQECYCRLLEGGRRRLIGFRGLTEPEARTWLARMAERCTRDRLRAERAGKRGGRRKLVLLREGVPLADPTGSPERRAIGRQELRRFARCCHRLSRSQRDARILRLVYFEGLTSREVARATGGALSPSSVDSVIHRFRRRLEEDGVPLPRRP